MKKMKIAAAPYDYEFPVPGTALVIIDMQRDFVEPGGFGAALGNNVSLLRPAIDPIASLLKAFRRHNLPVIHTVEGHKPDLSDLPESKRSRGHCSLRIGDKGPMGRILILGESGNQIIPELAPVAGEYIIEKPGKGAFYATPLEAHLKERHISHLIITGVTTEVCVQTTMREANDRGYECLLVEDGTESYFPEFKRVTLDMIRAQGAIVGWTAASGSILAALEHVDD